MDLRCPRSHCCHMVSLLKHRTTSCPSAVSFVPRTGPGPPNLGTASLNDLVTLEIRFDPWLLSGAAKQSDTSFHGAESPSLITCSYMTHRCLSYLSQVCKWSPQTLGPSIPVISVQLHSLVTQLFEFRHSRGDLIKTALPISFLPSDIPPPAPAKNSFLLLGVWGASLLN